MPRTTRLTDWDTLNVALTVPEAAKVLRIGRNAMYQLAQTPGFPAVRVGNRIIVSRDGLRRWLERGGAAAANERDALAAIGGRSQAAAAASVDSIARPAVQ